MTEQEIIDRALNILDTRLRKPERAFNNPKDVTRFLTLQFKALEHESFRIMLLDTQHRLLELKELFRGTIDGAAVYPREVVKTALAFNASAVILSHNHPSGCPEPSEADKRITRRLQDALQLVDIRVLDHIVVGGTQSYSFAEHGLI